MKKSAYLLLVLIVLLIAGFLHFYKLGQIPNGLYQDETAIGYNAYSILTTGRDEYGKYLPLYFKSFGDYKLPVYVYLTIVSVKLFGLNAFAVRFPSAAFGALTVLVFYFLLRNLTNNKPLALVATALLAINPWHLHYSRAAFEVSVSLFFFILGTLLLHRSLTKGVRWSLLAGTVCFIISLYSYNLTRVLAPLLYALVTLNFRKGIQKLKRSEIIATFVVSIILLLPFTTTLLSKAGVASSSGTLIFSSAVVQAPLLELRSYMIGLPSIVSKTFFNLRILTLWQYLQNVAGYFSVPFFFLTGASHGNHGIGNVGQFYLFELPLVLVGLIRITRVKSAARALLLGWGAIVIALAALTRDIPHATRSFFLLVPMVIFSAMGLLAIISWLRLISRRDLRMTLIVIGLGIMTYNLIYYFASYYVRFPVLYAKAWRSADKDLAEYIGNHESEYRHIIFDKQTGFIYTSLLFYDQFSPGEFQTTAVRKPDDSEGFSEVISFGKYQIRDVDWQTDYQSEKTLIITTPDRKPLEIPSLATFYYPKRPVVLAVKQEIMQYPVQEVAYIVIKSPK